MKTTAWRDYLEQQRQQHGKVLFTITELAHVAGLSAAVLNVELARLRKQRIITRFAHGLYGLAGAVNLNALVAAIDSHAYITGHFVLYSTNMIRQAPATITCFTDRRSPRAQQRTTPLGKLAFVCVRSQVYSQPENHALADSSQALCDFVYLARRRGTRPESLVTFANLDLIHVDKLRLHLPRYPKSVQYEVQQLVRHA